MLLLLHRQSVNDYLFFSTIFDKTTRPRWGRNGTTRIYTYALSTPRREKNGNEAI